MIGEQLSSVTGYPLQFTENSAGGYKDWCIQKLNIPSYTIEVGDINLEHPITEENLPEIFEQNKDVPLTVLNTVNEITSVQQKRSLFNLDWRVKKK